MSEQPNRELQHALAACDRQRYQANAEYHATVNQLALMLPAMLDGIGRACDERESERAQLAEAMMHLGPIVRWPASPLGDER